MSTTSVIQQHDKFLDSIIAAFGDELKPIVTAAQKKTLKALEKKLTFAMDGSIDFTPANQLALRSIDRLFKRQMQLAGYDKLTAAFADQFADHLPKFEKVLADISDTLATPLPAIKFTAADVDLFASQATGAKEMLADIVDTVGAAAKRQALFSSGGLKFSDLASELGTRFSKTVAEANTLADTSVSMFYRTIASQSYAKIEDGLAPNAVRYFYAGPSDELERPFCAALTSKGKTYTRAQIDDMDNGTGLPVFTSGGGYRCRHLWILNVAEAQSKGAA